jgi:hypothetical protein
MIVYWQLWSDMWRLGLDAQYVVALRLAKISRGGAEAGAECRRMVSEKIAAAAAGHAAATSAVASGKGLDRAAARALAPVKRTVRANRRRLSRTN